MKNTFWFGVAGIALLVAYVIQSPYMAYCLYAFVLLVFLAHFSSMAWLSGLDCTRSVSQTILRQGEETDVEVSVTNSRGWPIPWIFFEDYHPKDFPRRGDNCRLAVLMPGRSVTLKYRLTCPRRGYHRIGPLLMESGDVFGLQKRFRTGKQQDYISVLPTIAYIDTFNISAKRPQGPVRVTNRAYEDPTRIAGVREYIPGDPLNRIHWKASARTGDLFTKITEPANVMGGTLILDLHDDSYLPEDKDRRIELAITTAASIAYLLQTSGEQVGLVTNARDAAEVARFEVEGQQALSRQEADDSVVGESEFSRISPLSVPTLRSPAQAQKIAENLARVVPGEGLDVGQLIMAAYSALPRDASLLPVVPYVNESLALILAQMKYAGFAVSVFLIDAGEAYDEAAGLLAQHEIHMFHITEERDLHEISPAKIGQ